MAHGLEQAQLPADIWHLMLMGPIDALHGLDKVRQHGLLVLLAMRCMRRRGRCMGMLAWSSKA